MLKRKQKYNGMLNGNHVNENDYCITQILFYLTQLLNRKALIILPDLHKVV